MEANSAFSLIEVLIVITVISVLVMVGIPAYKEYTIRARVNSAYTLLQDFAKDLQIEFQRNGTAPNNVSYNGVSYPMNTNTASSAQNITFFNYTYFNNGGFVANATLDNSAVGLTGTNQQIWFAGFPDNSGVMKYACGMWTSTDTGSVPLSYQPPNCQCVDMDQLWANNFTVCN